MRFCKRIILKDEWNSALSLKLEHRCAHHTAYAMLTAQCEHLKVV